MAPGEPAETTTLHLDYMITVGGVLAALVLYRITDQISAANIKGIRALVSS